MRDPAAVRDDIAVPIILEIIKRTDGKGQDEAEISLWMFCRAARGSAGKVVEAIREMEARGIIERIEPGYDFPFRPPAYRVPF